MDVNSEKWDIAIERATALLLSGSSLMSAFSAGKDSTAVVIIMLEAIKRLVEADTPNIPPCYIMNSRTRRDMPMMDVYVEEVLVDLQIFVAKYNLPVEIIQVEPAITGRWTWTTLGRGKLPRFVGTSKDCSVDEKISPMNRAVSRIEKESNCEIISLVGSRFSESQARAKSMSKFSMSELAITEIDGRKTYSIISDWYLDDVWDLIIGCSVRGDATSPRLFDTFRSDFDTLSTLYRDANDGVCGLVVDNSATEPCGSRFGCSWCFYTGKTDKSLESMIRQDEVKYGFMKPLVAFRNHVLSLRWDMSTRDFRGRNVSPAGFLKITPDYLNSRIKRSLLRYLLTIDQLEIERAREHTEKWYAGEIEHTEHNKLLCDPMYQFITYDDVLLIDFIWSLQRDFNEASAAAKDWIEIRDLGYRYRIPERPTAERVTIPKRRWFDVSKALPFDEDVDGLFHSLVPEEFAEAKLDLTFSDELTIEPGSGFCYIGSVRHHYYELNDVNHQEVCRAALANGWITMRKADLARYDRIARRHDYIYKLMQSTRPLTENEEGEDKLMTVDEYLVANSISDDEHKEILAQTYRKELESEYEFDLLGVDSVVEAMQIQEQNKGKKSSLNKTLHSIESYEQASKQISISL